MTQPSEEQPAGIVPGQLDLSTLVDLPDIGVTVDEVFFAYSPHWRWSLLERSRFGSLYSEMLNLERKDNPSAKDQQRFSEIQTTLCTIICPDMPLDLIKSLPSDAQRSAMIIDFLTKSGNQAASLIPREHANILALINTSARTGGPSSPDSKARTAVTRSRGLISPIRS